MENAYILFQRNVEAFPQKSALSGVSLLNEGECEKELSYEELNDEVLKCVGYLRGIGVTRGSRVLMLLPVSIELYVYSVAVLYLGACAVFVEQGMGLAAFNSALEQSDCSHCVSISKARLLSLRSSSFRRIKVKVFSNALFFEKGLKGYLKHEKESAPAEPVSKGDEAIISFTSGSTGKPKAIVRTHEYVKRQSEHIQKAFSYKSQESEFCSLPVFVLNNLACGVSSVLPVFEGYKTEGFNSSAAFAAIISREIDRILASPYIVEQLCRESKRRSLKMPSIKRVYSGGAAVSSELMAEMKECFPNAKLNIVYGSSEAEPISILRFDERIKEISSNSSSGKGSPVGKAVDGVELRIMRPVDKAPDFRKDEKERFMLAENEPGEIIVRGELVNKGYLNNPEAERKNKINDSDGSIWHRTGDAGLIKSNGEVFILGRVSQMIFKDGKCFFPLQVESLCSAPDFVDTSAYMFIPMLEGPKYVLVVKLKPVVMKGKDISREEARKVIQKHLNSQGFPVDIISFDAPIFFDPRHNSKVDYERTKKALLKYIRHSC